MKKQAIIPLFIPHMGCQHECVFCNQNTITASDSHMDSAKVKEVMGSKLMNLEPLGLDILEAAFYGGSFTGLPLDLQRELLGTVLPYKQAGRINKIRLSTRPDYINQGILDLLKQYSVDTIELGVQSFDDKVLSMSNRGHTVRQAIDACQLVQMNGFSLGIQLMIGLPGDSKELAYQSAVHTVNIKPDFVRIYPTVILEGSQLATMFRQKNYIPLTAEQSVEIAKDMVRLFNQEMIPVIRLGLKSTDNICTATDLANAYHPAFRQLVESSLAFDEMKTQLRQAEILTGTVLFSAHPKSFSNLIGHKGVNKRRFAEEYPNISFIYKPDSSLPKQKYIFRIQK